MPTHRSSQRQAFENYLQNKITSPQLLLEELNFDEEEWNVKLLYDGNLAHRGEQQDVKNILPEYFLMACRKGITDNMVGRIKCTENSDYLLFEFQKQWFEKMESNFSGLNWATLQEKIQDAVEHDYGEI